MRTSRFCIGVLASQLRRFLANPSILQDRWALLRDQWHFVRQLSYLATANWNEQGPSVLIVSLNDWVAQIKCEVMLSTALRLQGWTPVVVTRSEYRTAQRYFRSAGIDKFVFLDDAPMYSAPEQVVQGLFGPETTLQELLKARIDSVDVGRHALSTLVRQLFQGSLDLSNSKIREAVRQRLLESLNAVALARYVMERVQPKLALFLEKGYSPYGEMFDAAIAQGIPVIQWVHGHRNDALVFKRYTVGNRYQHPFSLSAESWAAAKRMPWTIADGGRICQEIANRYAEGNWFNRKFHHHNRRIKNEAEVREQLGLYPGKKTAVIFSHVLWDATFFYGDNLFDDYEQWLIATVQAASRNSSVNWVVKIHPDYIWKLKLLGGGQVRDQLAIETNLGRLPDHVKILAPETDLSTFSLFGVMDYCLTVRGTIGIEAACFGIPVLTAGTGRYSGFGFTTDSETREAYLERLAHLQDMPRLGPKETELACRHAYALLRLRPCPFTTFEVVQQPLERMGTPLDHNVVIRVRSFEELRRADDLKRFTTWVAEGRQEDFLLLYPNSALVKDAVEATALVDKDVSGMEESGVGHVLGGEWANAG